MSMRVPVVSSGRAVLFLLFLCATTIVFAVYSMPAMASFAETIPPGETVTIDAGRRYAEIVITNPIEEEVCVDVKSKGYSGKVCVPPNSLIELVKIFEGLVQITNLNKVATITIHGKWL